MSYFSKFPTIEYEGKTCVDISRRIAIRRSVSSDPRAYRPYDVQAGLRTDQLADAYYDNVDKDWLVMMSASVLDPYYDWYLSDRNFAVYLIDKYGSLEETVERVHHWQVNWYSTDAEISTAQYESLADSVKKYYEPIVGPSSIISSYVRREVDAYCTTNMIVTAELSANHAIAPGDRVQVLDEQTLVGQAEVNWSNTTHVKLIHVQSPIEAGLTIRTPAGVTADIVSREYTSNVIPVEERVFWEPVSVFEWERDKNESLKSVRLIDARLTQSVENELDRLLAT